MILKITKYKNNKWRKNMPVKISFNELLNKIYADHKPHVKVGEGKYTLKLISAENTKSRAGKNMSKLTWEVTEGPAKGGQVRQYIVHNVSGKEDDIWKLAFPVRLMNGFNVPEAKWNGEAQDDYNDVLVAITVQAQKCVDKKAPFDGTVTLSRKLVGTNQDGKEEYKDYFNIDFPTAKVETEPKTEPKPEPKAETKPTTSTTTSTTTNEDDFYAQLERN